MPRKKKEKQEPFGKELIEEMLQRKMTKEEYEEGTSPSKSGFGQRKTLVKGKKMTAQERVNLEQKARIKGYEIINGKK